MGKEHRDLLRKTNMASYKPRPESDYFKFKIVSVIHAILTYYSSYHCG